MQRQMQVQRAQMAFVNHQPHLPPEPDPFSARGTGSTSPTPAQIAHLEWVFVDPSLFVIFPFTKAYLEATPGNCTETLRVQAKAEMDKFFGIEPPGGVMDPEMLDILEAIVDCPDLSDQAKAILLITTFIPPGRVASYRTIRDWLHEARGMTLEYRIISALKKCTLSSGLCAYLPHNQKERWH